MAELANHPVFQNIVEKHLKPHMPDLPEYTVDSVSGVDNSHDWRRLSIFRDGFKTCLSLLGVANDR